MTLTQSGPPWKSASVRMAAICLMVVALVGCSTPSDKTRAALEKVQKAESIISTNRAAQVQKAAVMVSGVGHALARETNRSPALMLAYDLNGRAANILGPPSYADGLSIADAVRSSLSPIVEDQIRAASILARIDGTVTSLQLKMDSLNGTKAKADESRDTLMVDQSKQADSFVKWRHRVIFAGLAVLGIFMAPFVLQVAEMAFPAFAPLTSVFGGLAAAPGRLLLHAVPSAAKAIGVVSAKLHGETTGALEDVTAAVKAIKAAHPEDWESKWKKFFLSATDDPTRETIRDAARNAPGVQV